MDAPIAAALTGVSVLLVCTVIIFILIIRHMRDLRRWEQTAEDNYLLGKEEASRLLREACDRLAENRQQVSERSQQALLLEILVTLDGYGQRLDRLDDKLRCISHYKSYTAQINASIRTLEQSCILLEKNIAAADTAAEDLRGTLKETSARLETLINALSGAGRLHQTVSAYAAQIGALEPGLRDLQEKADSIVTGMNTVMTTHDQSPARKLTMLQMEVTGLNTLVASAISQLEDLTEAVDRLQPRVPETSPEEIP